jgi:hypothetical protein
MAKVIAVNIRRKKGNNKKDQFYMESLRLITVWLETLMLEIGIDKLVF